MNVDDKRNVVFGKIHTLDSKEDLPIIVFESYFIGVCV